MVFGVCVCVGFEQSGLKEVKKETGVE